MQRFFSTFPAGLPGVGLLLLRFALGLSLISQLSVLFGHADFPDTFTVMSIFGAACGLLILMGMFTPLASVALILTTISVGALGLTISEARIHLMSKEGPCMLIAAAAVTLLGPGAYSLDARFFGRREIIVPNAPRT